MKDRAMQALHLLALDPVAETTADLHSYGFRPERSTADAIQQCFNVLSAGRSAEWVLEEMQTVEYQPNCHFNFLESLPQPPGGWSAND